MQNLIKKILLNAKSKVLLILVIVLKQLNQY